tara:strand:- start:1439 stop:2125 length:687 start_codon:yes stop_codon:yes gene_type:complete
MKDISFLIATYNNEKKIIETIKSASRSCRIIKLNFEIVVIDDCSSDKTYKILTKLKKKNKFLKILKNKENLGFSKSIFKAAKKAKGKNIKILHAANIENSKDIQSYLKKSKTYQVVLTYFIDKRIFFRRILSRTCSLFFSVASGKYIKYFNSSLLCNRRDFINFYPKNFSGNFFLSVIISKLLISNYTYTEVKVYQKHPKKGSKAVSLVNLKSFFHALMIVFLFRLTK